MSKRVPVYLSEEELKIIDKALMDLYGDRLFIPDIASKLMERLEAELATFEE